MTGWNTLGGFSYYFKENDPIKGRLEHGPYKYLGKLSYWEANQNLILRWGSKTDIPSVYTCKLNLNANFHFDLGMSSARTKWGTALGRAISSSSSSSANIAYYGGTVAQINNLKIFDPVESWDVGWTVSESSLEGVWKYNSNMKYGYKITEPVRGYIVDRWPIPPINTDPCVNVCTHEMGHALGWHGHTPDWNSVMYPLSSNITTLTNIDKRHLTQVYN